MLKLAKRVFKFKSSIMVSNTISISLKKGKREVKNPE
jgi:hypothetical protein